MIVDQVERVCEDLVIMWSRTSGDTCQDHGGVVADMRLQRRGWRFWSQNVGSRFAGFGPKNSREISEQNVALSESLRRGEASS